MRSGRVTVRDYWSPVACPSTDSQAEVIAQLRDLLAVVVDAHLSGGLDSSAVTVLASQSLRRRSQELRACFSWSPAREAKDEPAKWRYQSELVSTVPVGAPEGSLLGSALLERWFDIRREIHEVLGT